MTRKILTNITEEEEKCNIIPKKCIYVPRKVLCIIMSLRLLCILYCQI